MESILKDKLPEELDREEIFVVKLWQGENNFLASPCSSIQASFGLRIGNCSHMMKGVIRRL